MKRVFIFVLVALMVLGTISSFAMPRSAEHLAFTVVDKTDTGGFTTISIQNHGSNRIDVQFYVGGTDPSDLHENVTYIQAGTTWEPPGNGFLPTVAFGYKLVSTGSNATTSWD